MALRVSQSRDRLQFRVAGVPLQLPDSFLDPPTAGPPTLPVPCPASPASASASALALASASAPSASAAAAAGRPAGGEQPSGTLSQQPATGQACCSASASAAGAASGSSAHTAAGASDWREAGATCSADSRAPDGVASLKPLMAPTPARAHHAHAPRWHFDMVQVSSCNGFWAVAIHAACLPACLLLHAAAEPASAVHALPGLMAVRLREPPLMLLSPHLPCMLYMVVMEARFGTTASIPCSSSTLPRCAGCPAQ